MILGYKNLFSSCLILLSENKNALQKFHVKRLMAYQNKLLLFIFFRKNNSLAIKYKPKE